MPPVTGSGYKLVNTVDQLKRGGSLRLTGTDLHDCAGNANRDFSHGLELGPVLDCGGTSPPQLDNSVDDKDTGLSGDTDGAVVEVGRSFDEELRH